MITAYLIAATAMTLSVYLKVIPWLQADGAIFVTVDHISTDQVSRAVPLQ